jgi:ribosome maturation factor RimP
MSELQETISSRLAELDPAIELIAVESSGPDSLRIFIDHPGGVDLALCERATAQLRDLLLSYSLEVSSPGSDRPLSKPEHFRRYLGRRVRVRTRQALEGRRNFTGTIEGADEEAVEVALSDSGAQVTIPHERIHRSNLVPDIAEGVSQ